MKGRLISANVISGQTPPVSEEKRDTSSRLEWLAPAVPGFRLVNTSREGRYRIVKEILTDPRRDVVLQQTQFQLLSEESGLHLYVLLAPHLGNAGWHNTAWVGDYKGCRCCLRNATALSWRWRLPRTSKTDFQPERSLTGD